MSETFFSINDLFRRKLQTSLTIISLTICVALTLFLLLFSGKIGVGIPLMAEGKLTAGFSMVFSQFIIFVALLIFIVGAVIISFMVFVMMSQRVRDIGLMKAIGCPNDMVFGYFMTELLIVTSAGCLLGVVLGILADFASTSLLNNSGFQISQNLPNPWLILLVFAAFFVIALIFGAKPILDTTKVEPAKAISPTYTFGLSKEAGFRVSSRSGFALKMAIRSLFRRKSATFRVFVCLTAVFILITVAVAGGIIANQTTQSWVEKAVGRDTVLVAHQNMTNQYAMLLSSFYETVQNSNFNYTDEKYSISEDILNTLNSTPEITDIDARLVLKTQAMEVRNYTFDPQTGETTPVGDDHEGESLIVGVDPKKVLTEWFVDGRFLNEDQAFEAVIGDSLAQKMFSSPLDQGIRLLNSSFAIVGVCIDPVDNGNVTYVPLKALQNVTGILQPNLVMIKIDPSVNRQQALDQIRTEVKGINSDFEVFDLNGILDKNVGFLGYIWSIVMVLPLFSLVSASLCLIGYVMLAIAEQRQEFGVLRAVGAKPRTVVKIVSGQSLLVLLSSCAIGIAFGTIITLLILVPNPVVTVYTVAEIAGWLLIGLAATFIFSLYPAVRFARKPIPEIMAQA
jgi:ABC-type antimicrobial peptide transport system permease subunit